MPPRLRLISLVVPAYNEQAVLPLLMLRLQALLEGLPCRAEVLFIDDGSTDRTPAVLAAAAAADSRLKVITLSRNFGQQAAIRAGLDHAAGDVVVMLDADLQDPPEMIPQMIDEYLAGADVVLVRRVRRRGETWLKRAGAAAFYGVLRRIASLRGLENAGEFRLMSRRVVAVLRRMPERRPFVRGMATWLGFRQSTLALDRPPRAAGRSKFSLRKMLSLAWHASLSWSVWPLRLSALAGLALTALAAAAAVVQHVGAAGHAEWLGLASLQLGLSGMVLLALGVQGEYLARVHHEVQGRPVYVVEQLRNVSRASRRRRRKSRRVGRG